MKLAQNPRKVRRMVEKGRFKIAGVTVGFRHGCGQISVYGRATAFHQYRQLEYKTGWYGTELVVADRWFASSTTCSGCGERHGELGRGQATWVCPACGVKHDRDVNAAVNLARWPSLLLETAA